MTRRTYIPVRLAGDGVSHLTATHFPDPGERVYRSVTTLCDRQVTGPMYSHHLAREWQDARPVWRQMVSPCTDCTRAMEPPSQVCDTDLSPSVSVQLRCPRMGEHVPRDGLGRPGERDGLAVPCPDCYSIVVTTIRVPWQPSRKFTITTEEK
jgi:hypothetical protein